MKKYNIIYADPAWEMGYVKGGKYAGTIKGGEKMPYPTMNDEEIMALPINKIAAEDAVLFMWTPDCKLPIMPAVMQAWGFRYVTNGFIWHKIAKRDAKISRCTLSDKTRRSCEYCYIGVKGKPQHFIKAQAKLGIKKPEQFIETLFDYEFEVLADTIPDLVLPEQLIEYASLTRKHSEKPAEVRNRIVQLYGNIPRIELFARQEINGWDRWGNEVTNSIIL